MRIYLEIYNNEKTYYYANLKQATPENVSINYPIVDEIVCVIGTDKKGIMLTRAPEPVVIALDRYGKELEDFDCIEDAVKFIEDKMNEPQPEPEPSAEESIASAMEWWLINLY